MENLRKKNIVFVIDSIKGGGAEYLVSKKAKFLRNTGLYNIEIIELKEAKRIKSIYKIISKFFGVLKKKYIFNEKILFHCHLTKAIYISPLIKLIYRVPVIITEHNTWSRRRRFKFLYRIETMIYKRSDAVVSVSNAVQKSLHKWLKLNHYDLKSSVVIHNGVELPDPAHVISTKVRKKLNYSNFLAVGSLTNQKGFDILLWHLHLYKDTNFQLHIAGVGSELKRLKDLTSKYGLSDKVTFLGFVDDLRDYYLQADVFLISSRWEGFGLIAVEALSYGLPIVWSQVRGLDEILNDCKSCFSFKLGDQSEFKYSLDSALTVARYSNTVKTSVEYAKRFNFDIMAHKYVRLYESLL